MRPRWGVKVACDMGLLVAVFVTANLAWLGRVPVPSDAVPLLFAGVLVAAVKVGACQLFGAYRSSWRYASIESLGELLFGTMTGVLGLQILDTLSSRKLFPSLLVLLLDAALGLLAVSGSRVGARVLHASIATRPAAIVGGTPRLSRDRSPGRPPRALIVGAGDAGEMVVREIRRGARFHCHAVGFVDDDKAKAGIRIHGVPVIGTHRDIPHLVRLHGIDVIILAIPSASRRRLGQIVHECRRTHADVKVLPDLGRLMDPAVGLSCLRPIDVRNLLGRESSCSPRPEVARYISGARVLVTGAGGSIGSELCRQLLRYSPESLVLLGRGENSIHQAHDELAPVAGSTKLVQVVGNVIHKQKLTRVFEAHRPQVIFHAAADKHVPLMEQFPDEAVLNNVIGTRNVLELAHAMRCQRVVCVSTDKAVRPTSVMGCSKRIAELMIRSPLYSNTCACAVRFGNVFGSRGSVVPRFHEQIGNGGPVTVTDRRMSRYFMTIPEAVELVLVAGALGRGREIFVLDMGASLRIWSLAENMARIRGREPGVDIEMTETGLRPGEKLHEELYFDGEVLEPTVHPAITRTRHPGVEPTFLRQRIDQLARLAEHARTEQIPYEMKRLVPEYRSFRESTEALEPAAASMAV